MVDACHERGLHAAADPSDPLLRSSADGHGIGSESAQIVNSMCRGSLTQNEAGVLQSNCVPRPRAQPIGSVPSCPPATGLTGHRQIRSCGEPVSLSIINPYVGTISTLRVTKVTGTQSLLESKEPEATGHGIQDIVSLTKCARKANESAGTRTQDLRIKSALLYRLSYTPDR